MNEAGILLSLAKYHYREPALVVPVGSAITRDSQIVR